MYYIFNPYIMSVVNFTIPNTLEERIKNIIKVKWFASKAEFFRYAAMNFLEILWWEQDTDEQSFDNAVKSKNVRNLLWELSKKL